MTNTHLGGWEYVVLLNPNTNLYYLLVMTDPSGGT